MNRGYRAGLFLIAMLFAAAHVFAQPAAPRKVTRVALVIGNSAYAKSPLANPQNDAADMAKMLEGSGFKVIRRENATLREMHLAVREFGDALTRDSTGLFYFAGHGLQVRGRNYLLPVDADIAREDEVSFNALDLAAVLEKMDSARNPTNLVILDACRNNPFANKFKVAASGLAQIDAPPGSIIAFATAPGSVAADGAGRNGLYTKYVVQDIAKPGVKIEDAFKAVRSGVRKESNGAQTPWESTSLEGEFYFRAPVVVAAKPKPPPKPEPQASESRKRALLMGAAPQFAIGDTWAYRITDHLNRGERSVNLTVSEIKDHEVLLSNGTAMDYNGNNLRRPQGDRMRLYTPAATLYVFPMSPGAAYEVKFREEYGDTTTDTAGQIRVLGEEELDTALGHIKAIKVERVGTWKKLKGKDSGISTWTYWYNANMKKPVRFEWTNQKSDGRMLNHETHDLVSYKVD